MTEEFILITHKDCGACKNAKKIIEKHGLQHKYTILDVTADNRAVELADKHNIRGVPAVIHRDKATGSEEVCTFLSTGNVACKSKNHDLNGEK